MIELEGVGLLALVAAVVAGLVLAATRRRMPALPPRIPDDHEHEWGQWEVIKQVEVHLYPDPDEGRDLPDRIDGMVRRTCRVCGLPQTRTIRGL